MGIIWGKFRQDKLLFMSEQCNRVLDFGQSAREDRRFFSEGQYFTCDIDPSIDPDIMGDICNLDMIEDGSYDGIICCAILEHVYDPFKGMKEIHRILLEGGYLFGYVPFLSSYHAKPGHYEDYFRFTRDGLAHLLKGFKNFEIVPVRGNLTTLLNLLPGRLNKIQNYFFWADRFFSNKQVSGYFFFAVK